MDPVKLTINKVKKTVSRYRMIDPGDLVLVAVSGGPDSVCLLDILHELKDEWGLKLVVAHYNHGLRQAEDESETQFVHRLAASMNLPFKTEKASIFVEGSTASLEERARNARYEFLERLKHGLHVQKIAVGHNLNDQAETVLMRFLRGSGPSGLSGIPPCRDDTIIRPLIEIKREEIKSYLKARKLTYVIDSSNLDTRYLRNKIRLELLPLLLEDQPRLIEHLGQLAFLLREDNNYLDKEAKQWVGREAERRNNGNIFIPLPSFIKLSQAVRSRVIRNVFMKICKSLRRIDYSHIQSVHALALGKKPQGLLDLPNGLRVKRIYDGLVFTLEVEQKPSDFCYPLEGLGTFHLEKIGRTLTLTELEGGVDLDLGHSTQTAYLDAAKLRYPLVARNFRPGDRFVPLGMTGHKKIKNFFMDLKIPSHQRAMIPILTDQDTPVWICGYRIDDRFKVTPETKTILKVTIT